MPVATSVIGPDDGMLSRGELSATETVRVPPGAARLTDAFDWASTDVAPISERAASVTVEGNWAVAVKRTGATGFPRVTARGMSQPTAAVMGWSPIEGNAHE